MARVILYLALLLVHYAATRMKPLLTGMASLRIAALSFLAIAALSSQARAQATPAVHSPITDPTEMGSPRLDPFEGVAPAPGDWVVLAAASYFNQWNGTWHTRRVHEDFDRERQPIGDDELRYLEETFPEDEIYRSDVEGSRFDLLLARGFGGGVSFQARIPWITIGTPGWDSVAETFHELVPVDEHYVRELFPRGETFFYLRSGGRSVVRRDEIARSGLGDIALSLGIPLHTGVRSSQRLALTVEVPTGKSGTLHGSGGYDAGVRWFFARHGTRNDLLVGAGYTHNSRSGSFFGFERSDTYHLSADLIRRMTPRLSLRGGVRLDSSALAGVTSLNLGDPVIFYKFGIQRQMLPGQWLSLEAGEEIAPQIGVDADFTLHIAWGITPASMRSHQR